MGMVGTTVNLFYVAMDVRDSSDTVLPKVDSSTTDARHVIHVENISDTPRGVKAFASLPGGTASLEFRKGGNATDRWDKAIECIPPFESRKLDCDLRRNGGPASPEEPLQCDEMQAKRGNLSWFKLTRGLPFGTKIKAA